MYAQSEEYTEYNSMLPNSYTKCYLTQFPNVIGSVHSELLEDKLVRSVLGNLLNLIMGGTVELRERRRRAESSMALSSLNSVHVLMTFSLAEQVWLHNWHFRKVFGHYTTDMSSG